jgi:hypothetical protein
MRTVEGSGRKEPVGFLEDVGQSAHHQDSGQCVERHRIVRSAFFFLFLDGRLTELTRHRE